MDFFTIIGSEFFEQRSKNEVRKLRRDKMKLNNGSELCEHSEESETMDDCIKKLG